MGWIEWARTRRQPFALVIDSFDAHEPWDAPRRLIDLYGAGAHRRRHRADPAVRDARRAHASDVDLTQRMLRRMRQLYAAEVTLVDVWLGRFLDRLANLGLADNTLVVLVSDHGVLLGERGWVGQALLGDARGADPRADGDAASRREGDAAGRRATTRRPTTSARPCSRCSAWTSRAA